jgi:hypothetical protein
MTRRQAKAARRALLLQLELESQLLRCKELDQQHQLLLHRQQETLESEAFHSLPAQELRETLGLEPPAKLERPPRSLVE